MKTIMWMQLFKNKTVFQQHIETIKKQMCGNDRECEVHWSTSPWRGNNRLIRAALAHQSNASERTHNMTVQMVLCKSKTRGSLIREPDSRKQTMSFGHAIYPCRQGAVGGWYRHSRPSSGSIWWCWWTDRWAVRHSAIFLSYFLPQPLIWVRRLARKGHWLSPDIQIRSAASTKGCAKHFFFYKCFPIIWSVSIPSMDLPRHEQKSTVSFFCLFERNVKHILVFWYHKGNSHLTNTSTRLVEVLDVCFFPHQQSTTTIHQF